MDKANRKEIISTLAFFNLMGKALTSEEILANLYKIGDLKPSNTEIANSLKVLETEGIVSGIQTDGRVGFHLTQTPVENRNKYNEELYNKAVKWSWIFRHCPYIEAVALCNNLGFGSAKPGSDIDLFIITKKNRLFTARLLITLLTQLFRIRRHGNKVHRRFCLSFFIDEDASDVHTLSLPKDIYFSYWLNNLKFIYTNNQTIGSFYSANIEWLSSKIHRPQTSKQNVIKSGRTVCRVFTELFLNSFIGSMIEVRCKNWQLSRARKKAKNLTDKTGTVLTEKILKFHNEDKRNEIHSRWKKLISTYF